MARASLPGDLSEGIVNASGGIIIGPSPVEGDWSFADGVASSLSSGIPDVATQIATELEALRAKEREREAEIRDLREQFAAFTNGLREHTAPPPPPKVKAEEVTPEQVVRSLSKRPDLLWGVYQALRDMRVAGPWVEETSLGHHTPSLLRKDPKGEPVAIIVPTPVENQGVRQHATVNLHLRTGLSTYRPETPIWDQHEAQFWADGKLQEYGYLLIPGPLSPPFK